MPGKNDPFVRGSSTRGGQATEPGIWSRAARVAVVIPAYRVERHIAAVIGGIPQQVSLIVVVDDASPDQTVAKVEAFRDRRVVVIRHARNRGVGGAMRTGYQECLRRGADIVVKMDGDGQMDPAYLPVLIGPLLRGQADYTKGNRWCDSERLLSMPLVHRLGNIGLSFCAKLASGNWKIFDPCNGYTALHASALRRLRLAEVARGYFFETSMLLHLNLAGAVVKDISIPARYGDEESSLRVRRILVDFPPKLLAALCQRIWRRYFVQDFAATSVLLVTGALAMLWGVGFGAAHWWQSVHTGRPATAGTVMLSVLPLLMGFQSLLQALILDVQEQPLEPLQRRLADEEQDSHAAWTQAKAA
jgi:dolichol-phosphate mannosyltransferase